MQDTQLLQEERAIANLTSFHFDQSGQVAKLSDELISRTGKSIARSNIDCNYLKNTVLNMSNTDTQESLTKNVNVASAQIVKNVEEIKSKLYKIFENPHKSDLRVLRETRIDKRRKMKLDERIEELKPRREVIRKYVEKEKQKIIESTAMKMKLINQ